MIVVEKNGKITIVYSDMLLMNNHCSSIYFRRNATVIAFTVSVTDVTSAPDDKSIGIEYCQNT